MNLKNLQRLYFRLFLSMVTLLLAGCASLTRAQTLEDDQMPTTLPEVTAATHIEVDASVPPADCPVTIAIENEPFKAPKPYSPDAPWEGMFWEGMFWYGTEHLWTALDADGIWEALPDNPEGCTQKIFWWSEFYVLKDELEPALEVMGRRLDAQAPALRTSGTTNASAGDIGDAMLTGVDFPTLGCWEITGHYKKSGLTFVVWVAP